jgi:hypothetical protein
MPSPQSSDFTDSLHSAPTQDATGYTPDPDDDTADYPPFIVDLHGSDDADDNTGVAL